MPPPTRVLVYVPERARHAVVYDYHSFDGSGETPAEARAAFDRQVAELLEVGVERVDPREPEAWSARSRGKNVRYHVGYREFVAVRLVKKR